MENINSKFSEIKDLVLNNKKIVISVIITFLLMTSIPVGVYLAQNPQIFKSRAVEKKVSELTKKEQPESSGYIIEFQDDSVIDYQRKLTTPAAAQSAEATRYEKDVLLPKHETAKNDVLTRVKMDSPTKPPVLLGDYVKVFNGIALNITEAQANEIKKSPFVKNVYPNLKVKTQLMDSVPLIGADKVWQLKDSQGKNITGEGVNVAIVDTGVDYTHPDLGRTPLVERNLQTIQPASTSFARLLVLTDDVAVYKLDYKIHIYSFSDGSEREVVPFSSDLWVRKAAINENMLVYYAMNDDYDAALYYYDLNSGIHRKIVDTQGVGEISISNGKVIYGRLKEPSIYSPGPYVYVYDPNTGIETALNQPVFMNSFESIMAQVDGNLIAASYRLSGDRCFQKEVIYNLDTGTSEDIVPPEVGPILDFKNGKILYVACDPSLSLQTWGTYYLYDIRSGEYTRLSNVNSSEGEQGMIGQNLKFVSDDDTPRAKADFFAEFYYGSFGSIGEGIVYFSQDYLRSKIIAYDQEQSRYVQVNLLKLPFFIEALGKKVCFTAEDYGIYCHTYDSNNPYSLPRIFNNKVVGGYDFIGHDDNPFDDAGHGTHVAATVAGNGVLKGVAPGANLIAYKALNRYGSGLFSDIMAALEKATQTRLDNDQSNNIDVINMSLGAQCYPSYTESCGPDDPVSRAVDNTVETGITAVIAAGNSGPGSGTITSPGTARQAITVGAVDKTKQIASFSSRGPVVYNGETINKPDVVAPGVSICAAQWDSWLSDKRCLDDNHIAISGTSMATPHVAGLVALIKQASPNLSPLQIKEIIKSNAQNLSLSIDAQGSGLVDAQKSLATFFGCRSDSNCPSGYKCQLQTTTLRYCPDNDPNCNTMTGKCVLIPAGKSTPTPTATASASVSVSCSACGADLNKDGQVNIADFGKLASCMNKKSTDSAWNICQAVDLNGDGQVNIADFSCIRSQYGKQCTGPRR